MSSVYLDIQMLLNEQLHTISDLPDIAYENVEFVPKEDEIYLEVHLASNESENPSIGINAPTYESGIFLINVVGIRGAGYGNIYTYVDKICNNFSRSTVLTDSSMDIIVRIRKSSAKPGFYNSEGRYVVPIAINYFTYNFS